MPYDYDDRMNRLAAIRKTIDLTKRQAELTKFIIEEKTILSQNGYSYSQALKSAQLSLQTGYQALAQQHYERPSKELEVDNESFAASLSCGSSMSSMSSLKFNAEENGMFSTFSIPSNVTNQSDESSASFMGYPLNEEDEMFSESSFLSQASSITPGDSLCSTSEDDEEEEEIQVSTSCRL